MEREYTGEITAVPGPRPSATTTAEFATPARPAAGARNTSVRPERRPCHMAFPASGSASAPHLAGLLRHRLLIAAIITGGGFLAFFIRNQFDPENFLGHERLTMVLQGVCCAVLVGIATLLGSGVRLSVRGLRAVELGLFGTLALFFGWLHFITFHEGAVLQMAGPEHRAELTRIANSANILRWFALIVIYGTFVPNTWRRCAVYTAVWAAIPVALMLKCMALCPVVGPYTSDALLDTVTILAVASAIAVFGSYKIRELEEEALQYRKLGQYQLKKKLGQGGMGEVYLAEHVMLRRACAVKLIRPDRADDGTTLSRFEREVRATATLTHPNTVEVFDYGISDDGTFYYAMEYLPGLSLQELVERYGPLPPARAVHFLLQVSGALREAHSIGLIHRDIKPSNVIACERGGVPDTAKLLDFGLVRPAGAKGDGRLTLLNTVLGSPPYMSPEQALDKDDIDARSDIYSVGGLAYFLLAGRPPFDRETPMQVLMAQVYDPPVPLSELRPEVPADLEAVVMKCLEKDRAHRFQDAAALEEALAACSCVPAWGRREAAGWWTAHSRGEALAPAIAG